MTGPQRAAVVLAFGALLFAACSPPSGVVEEKSLDAWHPTTLPGRFVECSPAVVNLRIHGDSADPQVLWLADQSTGARFDAVWPDGYRARFDPNLEVVNESNVIVLREGDVITRACVTGLLDVYWLDPPFQTSATT